MSTELRRVTLRNCRNYLRKLDKLKSMADSFEVIASNKENTPHASKPALSAPADLVHQRGAKLDRQGTETEKQDQIRDSLEDHMASLDLADKKDPVAAGGNNTPPASNPSSHSSTPPMARMAEKQSKQSPSPADTQPPACRKHPRHIITTAEIEKFTKFHHALSSIVESIRRNMSRRDRMQHELLLYRWKQADGVGKRDGPLKPKRKTSWAVWRGGSSPLCEEVVLDEWLWEEEMEQARHECSMSFTRDADGRRVLKI